MLETHYKILKILESNPNATQREIAGELGISLGKTNYCLKALVKKGWIKMKNFKNNKNKLAYAYILTPHGVKEKAALTLHFLTRKMAEYKAIRQEIEDLRSEIANTATEPEAE